MSSPLYPSMPFARPTLPPFTLSALPPDCGLACGTSAEYGGDVGGRRRGWCPRRESEVAAGLRSRAESLGEGGISLGSCGGGLRSAMSGLLVRDPDSTPRLGSSLRVLCCPSLRCRRRSERSSGLRNSVACGVAGFWCSCCPLHYTSGGCGHCMRAEGTPSTRLNSTA